ncbi:DNA circularization N-terminal domain-containing protein [Acinetobacter junii]|uniref:DNA circularization protein n=1 Tax=Acinetobacter junii TaxID=40215 RepID=UPI0022EACFC6|nr:DNA circularization N-terminal domain-containing protein [Acinetobacter junii]MDA3509398.1 DNA circularization N-terminal domain-containing protein [Acinetobacter junii]MDA3533900.1 DNA circularization N-terminal domain-containing protein [Acinetobacter junii]
MGWKDDLQDASFRGVPFECTTTTESGSKSLAVKQAPYSNKAYVEDMGNAPLRINIDAVFTGENYKTEMDALWAALVATGSGELIHPVHGVMQVNAENYNIVHKAEDVNACTIAIEFIQAEDKERPLFIPVSTPTTIDTDEITATPAAALDSTLQQLEKADPNQFFTIVNNIRNGVNAARQYLGTIKNTIETALSPADMIVGLVDDVTQLATFDSNISAISKWRDLFNRVQRFEKLFQDDDIAEVKQTWRATQIASQVSITQKVVASVRQEMAENKQVSFTPVDLAVIRQQNRTQLQQAIRTEREQAASDIAFEAVNQVQVYKHVADQIRVQIQELIELRPPITKTQILVPCTLHYLAHSLYGDMERAEEIRRLNPDLLNPAVLQIGMELTVYAR